MTQRVNRKMFMLLNELLICNTQFFYNFGTYSCRNTIKTMKNFFTTRTVAINYSVKIWTQSFAESYFHSFPVETIILATGCLVGKWTQSGLGAVHSPRLVDETVISSSQIKGRNDSSARHTETLNTMY